MPDIKSLATTAWNNAMVRINRIHGFTERLHQLRGTSEKHPVHDDCTMEGGSCECICLEQCKYIKKDGDTIVDTSRPL